MRSFSFMHAIATLVLLAAFTSTSATAQPPADDVVGRWIGVWQNSNGSEGQDHLVVREFSDGRIEGVWGKDYHIVGRRIGFDRYAWEAQSGNKYYRANAQLVSGGERLVVQYTVDTIGNGRRHEGRSQMTRAGFRPY